MTALEVFTQTDGAVTKGYYADLSKVGPIGLVAMNLFRAQKTSEAAKRYRGGVSGVGSYKSMAYDRKNYSLQQLCEILTQHGEELKLAWGWKPDPKAFYHAMVIYVDLPQGQCSFHSGQRMTGPDYPGDWDGKHASRERILAFCDAVMNAPDPRQMELLTAGPPSTPTPRETLPSGK